MGLFDFLFGRVEADRDGSCPERAIVVPSMDEEYQWVHRNCPGFTLGMQGLQEIDGKPYDVLTLCSPSGEERRVYFDVSGFFGKRRAGGPRCPYCAVPLRTDEAKQCFECGMDWRDPANVVRRGRKADIHDS
jgi:hypothetical protein